MHEYTIRRATPADAERLATFAADCFEASYGAQNTPANMAAYLAQAFTAARMHADLVQPGATTLVMERDDVLTAYAMIGPVGDAPACVSGPAPIELRRFYVAHAHHGAGLAPALMSATLEAARDAGGGTLWCSVWQRNPRAIRFYGRHGFVAVGTAVFMLGDDRQDDWVLARELGA